MMKHRDFVANGALDEQCSLLEVQRVELDQCIDKQVEMRSSMQMTVAEHSTSWRQDVLECTSSCASASFAHRMTITIASAS